MALRGTQNHRTLQMRLSTMLKYRIESLLDFMSHTANPTEDGKLERLLHNGQKEAKGQY